MSTCKDCLCYEACHYHIDEETTMTVNECSTGLKHKDQYVKLPAYIGMKVWVPHVWRFKEVMSDLREGHVSGMQQKADKSWKIRVTRKGTVADYTVEEFNKYCFLNREDAEKYIEEKIANYK